MDDSGPSYWLQILGIGLIFGGLIARFFLPRPTSKEQARGQLLALIAANALGITCILIARFAL